MKYAVPMLGAVMLLSGASSMRAQALAPESMLSGVVRDAHGIPQMGALIELLAPDASVLARAFTDDRGRYVLPVELPGKYQLRASAAFLTPAFRDGVRLRAGVHMVADFTMTALFEAGAWLPAERRTAAQPSDDWRWALRSTANRPLLRVVGDENGPEGASENNVSTSAERHTEQTAQGQVAMLAGDGAFGAGGRHQVIAMDRSGSAGQVSFVQADMGDHSPTGNGASVDLAAGLEQQRPFAGQTRLVVAAASHPEILSGGGPGLQVLRVATTEQVVLGDVIMVDAGTLFTAENLLQTRMQSAPFLRAGFRMTPELTLEYRVATNRALQRSRDLDSMDLPLDALADSTGTPLLHRGLHQEISLTENSEGQSLTLAAYRTSMPVIAVQGTGALTPDDLAAEPLLADPTTGAFRLAASGFTTGGARVAWKQVFSPAVAGCLEAETGSALLLRPGKSLAGDTPTIGFTRRSTVAIAGAVHLAAKRTGTDLEAHYRWQPFSTLTQVDAFDTPETEAYATLRLRQKVYAGRRLKGVNAVVEATNLLAQGYQPVMGADGDTLFLAQVPRSITGGLAFTF